MVQALIRINQLPVQTSIYNMGPGYVLQVLFSQKITNLLTIQQQPLEKKISPSFEFSEF